MLKHSASKKALQENIGKEIAAGRKPSEAAAIAYSVQRHERAKQKSKGK